MIDITYCIPLVLIANSMQGQDYEVKVWAPSPLGLTDDSHTWTQLKTNRWFKVYAKISSAGVGD